MVKRLLLASLLCLGLGAQDTVVVLLRHAEKTHRGATAELSARGLRRAASLPEDLLPYQATALYASDLKRTQQTLAPLAQRLGLPVQVYARGTEAALGQTLRVRHAGQTVIVCGHSDTLTDLVRGLGDSVPFPEVTGFDRFWVLRVAAAGGAVTLEEHRQRPVPAP